MVRHSAKNGANAVSFRRFSFLAAAIVTFVTAIAGMRPASAQSVSGTGDLSPNTVQTPSWLVGADLRVGNTGTGTLSIQNGGTVTNNTGFVG
jgi:fibronectin-binding autotransporter adhesin